MVALHENAKHDHQHDIIRLRQALDEKPRNARLLSQLAVLLHDQGKRHEHTETTANDALRLAQKACQLQPTKPCGYMALSLCHPDFDQRMRALDQALNLAKTCQPPLPIPSVIVLYQRRLIEPRDYESTQQQGTVGQGSNQHANRRALNTQEETVYQELSSLLQTSFENFEQNNNVVDDRVIRCEYALGRFFRKRLPVELSLSRARLHYSRVVAYCSDTASPLQRKLGTLAQFWLATTTNDETTTVAVTKCPPEYVVDLYSTFCDRFDDLLVHKLDYQTPTQLRNLLNQCYFSNKDTSKPLFGRALDLGCGTGLSGLAFEDCVDTLYGIDLSPDMIAKAAQRPRQPNTTKPLYDKLVVGDVATDIGQFRLEINESAGLDLIFACDVFVYLGDLTDVFALVSKHLAPGGLFCFSTEFWDAHSNAGDAGSHQSPAFRLGATGRFAHTKGYLEALSSRFNFRVLGRETCPIRKNGSETIMGILMILLAT